MNAERTVRTPDLPLVRWAGVAVYSVAMLLLLTRQSAFRAWEAGLASFLNGIVGAPTKWARGSDVFYVGIGTNKVFALQLVTGCSTALLIIPMLLLAGIYVHFGRVRLLHMTIGLLLSCVAMLAVNMIRLVIVGVYTVHSGRSGFELAHTIIGSLIVLAGGAVTLLLFSRWISMAGTVAAGAAPIRARLKEDLQQ
ncbi:exosortase/archaeosortase family protein [Rhodococcus sp. OK302]|uniref:exosortase/archaeosortase family protein n=1 Tax=Rhodococcus sp. OK302 TaxID=1882769 RepID=UPI000B942E3E|nr:exosortase/archaeosortase family protein [Rhodococcus sp. OK302]OYD61139.1 exosortase/archaeosortase family protein [Rhodococcus sp. OK302]